MKKTIQDYLFNYIAENYILNAEEINTIIEEIKIKKISKINIFGYINCAQLNQYGIIYLKDMLELSDEELKEILKKNDTQIKLYIDRIKNILEIEINKSKEIEKKKKIAVQSHEKILKKLIEIKENPKTYSFLKEDINYLEESITNTKEIKKWKHSALNIEKEEIPILKKYLLGNTNFIDITQNNPNAYASIINIYDKLDYYTKKLEYKQILIKNYDNISELNLSKTETNKLERLNIKTIADLIEYPREILNNINGLGKKIIENINRTLNNRNIIYLEDKIELLEKLKEENAGIKTKQELIKQELKTEREILNEITKIINKQAKAAQYIIDSNIELENLEKKLNHIGKNK